MIADPSASPMPPIAVVIPAYRAEEYIGAVLDRIPAFVSAIVVVDDCSPDGTAALVQQRSDTRLHLVSHATNQGVGAAVLTGYRKAIELGAEIIVKMDSDDQMDPAYLIPLVAPLVTGQADYAKGNRFLHAGELRSMPVVRRIGNAGLSLLIKAASGYWNLFDPANGYTAIRASIVPLLDATRIHPRYFFESSMLMELGLLGAVIRDVHIPARYTGQTSSLSEWKALLELPPRLLGGFLRRVLTQYFIRDFGAFSLLVVLGLLMCIFGAAFGLYHWILSNETRVAATTGTVMIAILPLMLGSQLLIQALLIDIQNTPKEPLSRDIEVIRSMMRKASGGK
ncbi:MAG: glycosyltransferase family 2 protein [Anaerolineae bacterium]